MPQNMGVTADSTSDDEQSLSPVQFSPLTEALIFGQNFNQGLSSSTRPPYNVVSNDYNVVAAERLGKATTVVSQHSMSPSTNFATKQSPADTDTRSENQDQKNGSNVASLPLIKGDITTRPRAEEATAGGAGQTSRPQDHHMGKEPEEENQTHKPYDYPRKASSRKTSPSSTYRRTDSDDHDCQAPQQPSSHVASEPKPLRTVRLPSNPRSRQNMVHSSSESHEAGPSAAAPPSQTPTVAVPSALKESPKTKRSHTSEKVKSGRHITVNGKQYEIARKLGRGGSGRVYEVIAPPRNNSLALKVIPLRNLDSRAKKQVENEVEVLENLKQVSRVIFLVGWHIDEKKKSLYLLMEVGQCDLDNLLKAQWERNNDLDLVFVWFHWREILECIASIHELDVVHSDVKPANFILARGILKIADFGIANALPDDTVNLYQDHQAGTPNYMAPETLKSLSQPSSQAASNRRFRVGKPSDMWSVGCILYLMVYGRPPFGHIQDLAPKLLAITDPDHDIEFPRAGLGGTAVPLAYVRTMQACLSRDPAQRPTARDLLKNANGMLPSDAMTDYSFQDGQVEALIRDALRDAGVEASPSDLEAWKSKVMENLHGSS